MVRDWSLHLHLILTKRPIIGIPSIHLIPFKLKAKHPSQELEGLATDRNLSFINCLHNLYFLKKPLFCIKNVAQRKTWTLLRQKQLRWLGAAQFSIILLKYDVHRGWKNTIVSYRDHKHPAARAVFLKLSSQFYCYNRSSSDQWGQIGRYQACRETPLRHLKAVWVGARSMWGHL